MAVPMDLKVLVLVNPASQATMQCHSGTTSGPVEAGSAAEGSPCGSLCLLLKYDV